MLSYFFLTAVDDYRDQKCATLSHQMHITVRITFIRNIRNIPLKHPTVFETLVSVHTEPLSSSPKCRIVFQILRYLNFCKLYNF